MSSSATHRPRRAASRLARLFTAGALVSAVGLVATNHSAQAAGFVVTTTADGGAGSLRDAIDQANANPGPDTITVPAGTYTLTLAGSNEDSNATGDFDITGDVTIIGAGAGVTIIDADGLDRVFDIQVFTTELQDMTITNGSVPGGSGGNIIERSGANLTITDSVVSNGTALAGAGISGEQGVMTILRTEIVDNVGVALQGNGAVGTGIMKTGKDNGTLTLTDSLVADNFAPDGTSALYISANATVTNTTVTGNTSYSRTVLVETYGVSALTVDFVHLTIAGNTATGNQPGFGLNVNAIDPATIAFTIEGSLLQDNLVVGNTANCSVSFQGVITSGGNNLADDASCFLDQPSDSPSDNGTTLAALADNGGPTRTLALMAGSSAIDAAGACGAVTPTDQRGVGRPFGAACDAGAYEADTEVVESTTTSTSTTSTTSTTTTTMVDTSTSTSTTSAATTSTTDLGSGGNGTTTTEFVFVPPTTTMHRGLPVTGGSPGTGLWLAALMTCLGGLLILGARRLAR